MLDEAGPPSPSHRALVRWGWTPFFARQWLRFQAERGAEGIDAQPARIVKDHGQEYGVEGVNGAARAVLSGRLQDRLSSDLRPTVGDWVLVEAGAPLGRVIAPLERATALTRKAAGRTSGGQTIAANVDVAFIVSALVAADATMHTRLRSLNPRRVERYLQLVRAEHIRPIVVVNKADLNVDAEGEIDALCAALRGEDIILVSANTEQGLDALERRVPAGETAVFIGSSGVGKSSLVNRLLGSEQQRVSELREADARGRHTTTSRDLLPMASGGLLIDTPGMRELGMWAGDEDDLETLDRLARFAIECRFTDCQHGNEPGCAVRKAIASGELDEGQLEHQQKLHRELEVQRQRHEAFARHEARKRQKSFSKIARRVQTSKNR